MIDKNSIPKHWLIKKLGEVCEIKSGKNQSKVKNPSGKYPIYGSSGIFGYADEYICDEGTVIIGRKGTINNPIYVSTKLWNVDTAFGLCSKASLSKKYLYYYCCGFNFHKLDKSTTIPSLAKSDLLSIDIPFPPLPEQQVIVNKIEELFSELDKGKQHLQSTLQLLRVYRQSLYKSIFIGKELVSFEEFVESSQNGLSKRNGNTGKEFKVLRLADINNNEINDSEPRMIMLDDNEINKYKIFEDDLICIRVNGSKDLVGKLIYVSNKNENENWAYCDHFIKFKLKSSKAVAIFFHFYFSTLQVRKYIHDNMVTSAGQNTVSQVTIKKVLVPNFTKEEQAKIVKELEHKFSLCDMIEHTINQSLQQAESLRQSILKQAFEGKLVTTDL